MSDKTDTLKTLHTRLIDSVDGYEEAQKHVSGTAQTFVDRCITERKDFHAAVHRALEAEGIDVTEKGSTAATAHRGVFKVRDAISSGDQGVLAECARGDGYLKESYDAAIDATKGSSAWDFLVDQRAKVDATINEATSMAA